MTIPIHDRIYAQYRNKPKTVAWYNIVSNVGYDLSIAFDGVKSSYDVDSIFGESLDVLGRVVATDRDTFSNIEFTPFEFDDDTAECGDPDIQCSALSVIADDDLSDEYFKTLIKSKIFKNNSNVTLDEVITAILIITPGAAPVYIIDNEDMTFSVVAGGLLTEVERQLLLTKNIIPKPQGVQFLGFIEPIGIIEFDDDTAECGDPDVQAVGYTV